MTLGNFIVPEILNISLAVNIDVPMAQGWNWMSLNIFTNDMSLNSTLSSLGDNAEYIKSQDYYADYYPEFGWFGSLESINNTSMFKLRMGLSNNIILSGIPANVENTVFDLPAGWSWIGYTPQLPQFLNTSLLNIPSGNAEYIKSQSSFADFYSEFGWYGTMEYMYPFIGYQIRLAEATSFVYHDGTDVVLSSTHGSSQNIYSLNIHDYEFNGTITSAIYSDGERINSDDYILAAFDGN